MKCNLSQILAYKNIKKIDLAKYTGLSQDTISRLCTGRYHSISFENLEKICTVLDITPNDFYGYDHNFDFDYVAKDLVNKLNERLNFGQKGIYVPHNDSPLKFAEGGTTACKQLSH